MPRTQSSPFVDTSIKPGAAAGQTTTNVNDHQSLKEIDSSTSPSSADIFSNSIQLPSVINLFSNYPPNRQQRFAPCSHRSSNPSFTVPRPLPRVAMRHTAKPSSQRKSNLHKRRGKFSVNNNYDLSAAVYSANFPVGHQLEPDFVESYQLEDELGSGGYGFVMTARDRSDGYEVAVKFIIKDKVPEHCWVNDPAFGKLPMEVVLLSYVNHESIVRCLDVYEDSIYFYLVQELHGSPWHRSEGFALHWSPSNSTGSTSSTSLSTPALSPSTSETSLVPEPQTPPHPFVTLPVSVADHGVPESPIDEEAGAKDLPAKDERQTGVCRRPSYDLFECIEQSEQKRLSEDQARYVFGQVVDAVHYLDSLGIAHRDIKDENVVIDQNLKIKLIDFGSATIVDTTKPRPEYDQFFGTAAYASSEILLKKKYKAAPAEVWTLGVLLSYLLAGVSPFPTIRDAIEGRIFLSESLGLRPPEGAMDLMRRCLDPDPETRITIEEIKSHTWLLSHQASDDA